MGQKKPLATVAVTRGELALLVFQDALNDPVSPGVIDANEAPVVLDYLEDWFGATKATHRAGAMARAIECGVGANDERYLMVLMTEYRVTLDELPDEAA